MSTNHGPGQVPAEAGDAIREWRPMAFGARDGRRVDDPLIEPLWGGLRVLVGVDRGDVTIRDIDGEIVDGWADLHGALAEAALSPSLVVDGYITTEVLRDTTGIGGGAATEVLDETPGLVQRVFLLNRRPTGRRAEHQAERRRAISLPADGPVAFVAIDLLWVDDQPLIDVPLQERKRLLESALGESQLVRRTSHVRPPLEGWYAQWRAFGFREVAVKSVNSRYTPGQPNDGWGTALIPRR